MSAGTVGVRAALRGVAASFGVLLREVTRLRVVRIPSEEQAAERPAQAAAATSGPPQHWLDYVAAHDGVWVTEGDQTYPGAPAVPEDRGHFDRVVPAKVTTISGVPADAGVIPAEPHVQADAIRAHQGPVDPSKRPASSAARVVRTDSDPAPFVSSRRPAPRRPAAGARLLRVPDPAPAATELPVGDSADPAGMPRGRLVQPAEPSTRGGHSEAAVIQSTAERTTPYEVPRTTVLRPRGHRAEVTEFATRRSMQPDAAAAAADTRPDSATLPTDRLPHPDRAGVTAPNRPADAANTPQRPSHDARNHPADKPSATDADRWPALPEPAVDGTDGETHGLVPTLWRRLDDPEADPLILAQRRR